MISARPNCAAECGTTDAKAAPSRTCRCQSSGRVMVSVWDMAYLSPTATGGAGSACHAAGHVLGGSQVLLQHRQCLHVEAAQVVVRQRAAGLLEDADRRLVVLDTGH